MTSGILFEQRQIYLTKVFFSNGESNKQRPIVLISNNSHNKQNNDVICCPITSNDGAEGRTILPNDYETEKQTLPVPQSVIKTKHPFFVDKSKLIMPENGRIKIKKELAEKVIEDIKEIMEIP